MIDSKKNQFRDQYYEELKISKDLEHEIAQLEQEKAELE